MKKHRHKPITAGKVGGEIIRIIFLGFFAVISVTPLIWVIISSFKSNKEILSSAFSLPSHFGFEGYQAALELSPIFKFFGNSIIISFFATVLNVLFCAMAAYAIARFEFRLKTLLVLLLSSSMLISTSALLMPIYRIMTALNLFDTRTGLIIVYIALGLPTSFFIMRSYFLQLPRELEEAAYIDGAGVFRTFFSIMLPLTRSGLATAAVLQFLTCWNEFMFALILTKSESVRTLPLALNYFTSQFSFNYTALFAALTMVIIPSIVVYTLLQEQVTGAMVTGAVKG
jgi:raffinose/stachyose/melibiose transport system permease protein